MSEKHFTIEEYLEQEEQSSTKHAFYDGEIAPVSEPSAARRTITVNLMTALKAALKAKPEPYLVSTDTKVFIESRRCFLCPDVVVVAGQPAYYEQHSDIITNPLLLIDVFSENTVEGELQRRFAAYRDLESFRQYVLLCEEIAYITNFYQREVYLLHKSHQRGTHHTLDLNALSLTLPVADIYAGVENLKA